MALQMERYVKPELPFLNKALQSWYPLSCPLSLLSSFQLTIPPFSGPSISESSLFTNLNRTVVTLTWEVPPTSIVTGKSVINSRTAGLYTSHTNQTFPF